ncbi:MAG: ferric reductase-like transmembrane domain-containing protein [Gemmatimonadota bacterium]
MTPGRRRPEWSAESRRRLTRHLCLAGGSAAIIIAAALVLPGRINERFSLGSAYLALALLVVTLALGPLNVIRSRPNPVSFNLRRDFGIWSAVLGLVHTVIGLTVHFGGRLRMYFLAQPDGRSLLGLRADPFGLANHTGLVAALLLLLLAAISNDLSLRSLGTARWRWLQRWAYLILALTILHGGLYQVLEKQRAVLVALFTVLSLVVLAVQLAGVRRHRADSMRRVGAVTGRDSA